MCGIVGFIGGRLPEGYWSNDAFCLIKNLFVACEHRGRDATGYVARTVPLDSPLSASTVIGKQPLEASRYVETTEFKRLRHRRCSSFIGHCRAATHGSPKENRNNHPHVGDRYALVHNGVLSNVEELQDSYFLDMRTDCDSEAILRLVEMEPDPVSGLAFALRSVKGSMAVAMYDGQTGSTWLASNGGRSLWLAHLPKLRSWVFASTDGIILKAVRQTFGKSMMNALDYLAPIADHVPLALTADGCVYAPVRR